MPAQVPTNAPAATTARRHRGGRIPLALLLASLLGVAAACDSRVPEPTRPSSAPARPPTAETESTAPSTSSASSPPASPARCVRPTPDTPARPAPPAGPDPRCPTDPGPVPKLRRAKVHVVEVPGVAVEVELAERHEDRLRGLMYRTELRERAGMLFIFDDRRVLSFWMKNTCLPLDMLFVDDDGFIAGIEENVPTMNTGSYTVPCPARYVLEVNAGWSRRHGVKAGHKLRFEGVR